MLIENASKLKDTNVAKIFAILANAQKVNIDQNLSQTEGGSVDVKAESVKTLTDVVDKLTTQYVDGAVAYQKNR